MEKSEIDEQSAIALIENGQFEQAEAVYKSLFAKGNAAPSYYCNLAVIYGMTGRPRKVVAVLQEVLKHLPDYPEAHNNLGNAFKELGDLEASILAYEEAIRLRPNYPDALNNLGIVLRDKGDLGRSIQILRAGLALDPGNPYLLSSLSHGLLQIGCYAEGWACYEARFLRPQCPLDPHVQPKSQRWERGALAAGERILVVSEQGLGDTLQFVRYVKTLRQFGLQVSVCVQEKLRGLMVSSGLDATPISEADAEKVCEGYWIPMMSLPARLDVTPNHPIEQEPYLHVSEDRVERWRKRFAGEPRPLVGINWQGNPSHEKGSSRGRSLPLEAFAPLAELLGGGLVSLQKGAGSEQMADCSFRDCFVGCQSEVDEAWDFEESAAVMMNCDLVISSDTSVVHLAGGLGVKTWVLLKQVPEWRWGLEGEDTFWYPSMRLFRQRERGNWDELMQHVALLLEDWLHDINS